MSRATKTKVETPVFKEASSPALGAQPFVFDSVSSRPTTALPALDRMGERVARRMRDVIEPFARLKPRVTPEPIDVRRFESWRVEKPEFTSVHVYRCRPLKGGVLLAIEPEFVSWLVDAFYGGTGSVPAKSAAELTATEERLLNRLAEGLSGELAEVWGEVMPVSFQLTAHETNTANVTQVPADDPVAVARYTIEVDTFRPTIIDVLYPVASLRAIESELTAKMFDDGELDGNEWLVRLCAALGNVHVRARSVLARPTMKFTEMMALAPGDVIPIEVPPLVPLIVEGRIIARGKIGEVDGRAALKIEKLSLRSSQ